MENREEFLNRIKNIRVEKEPRTDGFELTKEDLEKQLENYSKVVTSTIYKNVVSGEER